MAKPTVVFGLLLIVLGLVGYFGTPAGGDAPADEKAAEVVDGAEPGNAASGRSVTALIPAFVGVVLLVCGCLAFNEKNVKHAMHAAAAVGLLGAIAGLGRGIMGLAKLAGDGDVNTRSLVFVWLMAILCAAFVAMCVRSFIEARKRREAAGDGAASTED